MIDDFTIYDFFDFGCKGTKNFAYMQIFYKKKQARSFPVTRKL